MVSTSNKSKKNLIVIMIIVFVCLTALCLRLGWIQIVKGSEYSEKAVEQQTRDTPIEARTGHASMIHTAMSWQSARHATQYGQDLSDVRSGETEEGEGRQSRKGRQDTLTCTLEHD